MHTLREVGNARSRVEFCEMRKTVCTVLAHAERAMYRENVIRTDSTCLGVLGGYNQLNAGKTSDSRDFAARFRF